MAPLFIDTDTASDDAVALMMAFAHRPEDIVGIGVVCGNCPLDQAVQNALYTAELCGADVPVYAGAVQPLTRTLDTAQHVHGVDGMGDIGLPVQGRAPMPGLATAALIEAARAHEGELELVTLGPLTNIAIALKQAPWLAKAVKRCVMMGGVSDYHGNMTPVSEYNIWADPEAADIVFGSGMPITMVGWDISRKFALIDPELSDKIIALGTEKARVAMECQATLVGFAKNDTGLNGYDLPDPIAMAVALRDDVVTASYDAAVFVAPANDVTRGQTTIDKQLRWGREANVTVVTEASREAFLDCLQSALAE